MKVIIPRGITQVETIKKKISYRKMITNYTSGIFLLRSHTIGSLEDNALIYKLNV